jgi:hypothetical protein
MAPAGAAPAAATGAAPAAAATGPGLGSAAPGAAPAATDPNPTLVATVGPPAPAAAAAVAPGPAPAAATTGRLWSVVVQSPQRHTTTNAAPHGEEPGVVVKRGRSAPGAHASPAPPPPESALALVHSGDTTMGEASLAGPPGRGQRHLSFDDADDPLHQLLLEAPPAAAVALATCASPGPKRRKAAAPLPEAAAQLLGLTPSPP